MNKQAILQTAIWTREDGCYVVESPLLKNCIGAAESKKEAWQHFVHHVDVAYAAYLEGRLAVQSELPAPEEPE
jgi:predicted RNase H-like HicB family nuclease